MLDTLPETGECSQVLQVPGGGQCTHGVTMAHTRPIWISVAEMRLYYIYSEWCSWLHSLAEGESWGPSREWADCAARCSVVGEHVDEGSGISSPCVPLGSEATRVEIWST